MADYVTTDNAVGIENNADEISSFTVFLGFLRRFVWLILLATVIGTGIGLGMAFVKDKKVYTQTKSVIFIAKIDNKAMATNISLTNKYIKSVQEIILTPLFITKANDIYKDDFSGTVQYNEYGGIGAGAISVQEGGGMILTISYSDYSEKAAADKLDVFIAASREELQGKLTADDIEFVSIDNLPKTTSSSEFSKFILLGALIGAVVGLFLGFIIYLFDNTVSSRSDLERLTGATVVAYLDDVNQQ